MESMQEDVGCPWRRRPKIRGHITTDQSIYKKVILVSIITKMSLWVENVGLKMWTGTLTWRKRGNDMATLSLS